jgi:hypothetical protein
MQSVLPKLDLGELFGEIQHRGKLYEAHAKPAMESS